MIGNFEWAAVSNFLFTSDYYQNNKESSVKRVSLNK